MLRTSAKQFQLHAAKQSSKDEANKAFLRVLKYSSGAVLEVCFLYRRILLANSCSIHDRNWYIVLFSGTNFVKLSSR